MAHDNIFFYFLSSIVTLIHNEELQKWLCHAADKKAYRAMQSVYANCMVIG